MCLPYLFQFRQFIEKYRVSYVPLASGAYKTTGDPFTDLTEDQKALLVGMLNDSYEQFTQIVAHNRKLSLNEVNKWADGKIFTGKQALQLGLIDELGSVSVIIKAIKEKAMIEGEIEWVKKEKPLNVLTSMFSGEQTDTDASLLGGAVNTVCATLENRYSAVRL